MKLGMDADQWRALTRPSTGYVAVKIALLCAGWLIPAWGAHVAGAWWTKLMCWLVAGFFVNGLVQLAHETWHHNLFRSRRANIVAGHMLGWMVGISYEPMRHDHLMHHKYNRTARDPDAYNAGRPTAATTIRFYAVALIGLPLAIPFFNILYPLTHMDPARRARHWRHLALYALAHAAVWIALWQAGWLGAALDLWVIPVLCASPFNGLKSIANHHANQWEGDRWHTATTVRSNRVVTYLWSGLNYHLDHHLYPRVPGYKLPILHAAHRAELEAHGAPVFDSYLKVFYDALRAGPTYTEEDHFLRPTERP
jgi:fatty acid desaturase